MKSFLKVKSYPLEWESLDDIVSFLGATKGHKNMAYFVCREKGSTDYKVMISPEKNVFVSLEDVLAESPDAKKHFLNNGFSLDQDDLNSFVSDLVLEDKWEAHYDKKTNRVQSNPRRVIAGLDFSVDPHLSSIYWSSLISLGEGRPEDKIFKKLADLMSVPATKESLKEGKGLLKKIMERRPGWEIASGLSLRSFAKNSPKWHSALDQFEISFKKYHNQLPLLVHAINKGYGAIVDGWCKETTRDMSLVISSVDLPESWASEEFVGGSVWHLIGAHAPAAIKKSLTVDQDVFDINHLDMKDRNALHWACAFGNLDTIQYLLDLGVSVHQEDFFQKTPAEYLPENKKEYDDLFDFIEKKRQNEMTAKIAS